MSGRIEIRKVVTRRDFRNFLYLPREIYRDEALWIPPLYTQERRHLDRKRDPFYGHASAEFFLALAGGRPVGRIAAIENRLHNNCRGDRIGFFGYYECIDNEEASRSLFDAAAIWLRERGLAQMRGPTNPTMNGNIGFLVRGFDHPPSMLMPYTKSYYIDQARAYGFSKAMDVIIYGWYFQEYERVGMEKLLARLERLGRRVKRKHDVKVRTVRLHDMARELSIVKNVCNEGLKNNWGYVPLTDAEMEALKRELILIVDRELFCIAELDGKPEAVFLACPDYNQLLARMKGRLFPFGWLTFLVRRKKIDRYIVYLFASTPRGEIAGINAPVYARFFRKCFKRRIRDYETGYILEANRRLRNMLEKLGATQRKRYRVFQKPV